MTINTIIAALTPAVTPATEKNTPSKKIDEDKATKKQNTQKEDSDQEQKKASAFATFLNAHMVQQTPPKQAPKKADADHAEENENAKTKAADETQEKEDVSDIVSVAAKTTAVSPQVSPIIFKTVAASESEMKKNNAVVKQEEQDLKKDTQDIKNIVSTDNTKEEKALKVTKQELENTQRTQNTQNNQNSQNIQNIANNTNNKVNNALSDKNKTETTNIVKNNKDIKETKESKDIKSKSALLVKGKVDTDTHYRVESTARETAPFMGEKQKFTQGKDLAFIEKQKQFLTLKRDESAHAAEAVADIHFQSVMTETSTHLKSVDSAVSVHQVPELILNQLSQGHSNIVFHLNPKNLGAVRVQINTASKTPTVNIIADKQEGYRELQSQLRALVRDIQQQFSGCSVNLVLAQNNSVSTVVVSEMKNDRQIQKQTDIKTLKPQIKRQKLLEA